MLTNQATESTTEQEQSMINDSLKRPFDGYFDVAPGVWGAKDIFVNFYMIEDQETGDWVLVDAGLKSSVSLIRRMALQLFGTVPPKAILLTHGHFDHVGALRSLVYDWDVPIYAHRLEIPYLTGQSAYPPPDPTVGGGMMAYMSFLYPKQPIDVTGYVEALPENGEVPFLKGWQYIHTPGHAPGHVSFFRQEDGVLIVGDAFVTTKQESSLAVMFQYKKISGPPAYFTYDWDASRDSVRKLMYLSPNIVATGHGRPMSGETMREGLHRLEKDFNRIARPAHGRYVHDPALADERGVTYVPSRPRVPKLWIVIGVAAVVATVSAALILKQKKGRLRR